MTLLDVAIHRFFSIFGWDWWVFQYSEHEYNIILHEMIEFQFYRFYPLLHGINDDMFTGAIECAELEYDNQFARNYRPTSFLSSSTFSSTNGGNTVKRCEYDKHSARTHRFFDCIDFFAYRSVIRGSWGSLLCWSPIWWAFEWIYRCQLHIVHIRAK